MKPEGKPGSMIASDTEHAANSAEWSAHEHVSEQVQQDEMKVSRHRVDMVQRSLLFVISARTQETAIVTWFGEAFTRDRGYGD